MNKQIGVPRNLSSSRTFGDRETMRHGQAKARRSDRRAIAFFSRSIVDYFTRAGARLIGLPGFDGA